MRPRELIRSSCPTQRARAPSPAGGTGLTGFSALISWMLMPRRGKKAICPPTSQKKQEFLSIWAWKGDISGMKQIIALKEEKCGCRTETKVWMSAAVGHLIYRNQTFCFPCWMIFQIRSVPALPVSGKASCRTHGVTWCRRRHPRDSFSGSVWRR